MDNYLEEACEEIDAAMFSGDAFLKKDNRETLKTYIGRWEREMKKFEELEEELKVTGEQ